jgi:inositol-phosphate phosphatase/L-galactose 1-phosphate phosphatase/histidinol-phosphatase
LQVSDALIALAMRLADAAGAIVMKHYRTGVVFDDKADSSPVTVADREAEQAMRVMIKAAFPDHGIVGEELGSQNTDAEHVWVLDPIDGTKAFITGKPLFGILIALLHRGRPVAGIIDHPALKERFVGVIGRPTLYDGRSARVRACPSLKDAWLYATSPEMFGKGATAVAFQRLKKRVKHPVYGAECYAYGLLAAGYVDLVVEATMKPVDYCALVPVVEGAGGVITDWQGGALGLHSDGRVIAAGDARIHAEARAILAG